MLAFAVFTNPVIDAAVILVIVLLIMGPKRLPELGKGLGRGMREFKEGITGDSKDEDGERPALSPSGADTPPAAAPREQAAPATPGQPSPPQGRESAEVGSEPKS